jgi:hypothetical protein
MEKESGTSDQYIGSQPLLAINNCWTRGLEGWKR